MEDKFDLLEVKDLTIKFPFGESRKEVVSSVSFGISAGEIIGLAGESGSGKTLSTLFLAGLVPSAAEVEFESFRFLSKKIDGNDSDALSRFQKELRGKSIGMIFQDPMSALNPTMTCGAQLTEMLSEHLNLEPDECTRRAKSYLQKVELDEMYFDRYPHMLSGGQLQRVVIALAICCEPKLLIADEPTTALDATVRKGILNLLKKLSVTENLAILFISHDLPAVGSIADRVMIMKNGKIVEKGPVSEIFKTPRHEYTRGLLHCLPTLDFEGERLPEISNPNPERPHKTGKSKPDFDSENPILKIENLSVAYKNRKWFSIEKKADVRALSDLSFEAFEGETLGIAGESGSGKSTLGKAIINLVETGSGNVFYKNQNLTQLTKNQQLKFRKDIQIIFQNPLDALNPRQVIGRGLEEILSVFEKGKTKNERRAKAVELLEATGLTEADFFKYPHEFSGGQRQRICIARALAVEPKILICDECVSSLDVSVQAKILNLLKDIQEQFGLTMLFISHDLGVLKFMSDRILVMKSGKLIDLRETNDLFQNSESNYVRELIDSVPKLDSFH